MNTSHYPSLELCKKLKEINFPLTEKFYQYGRICDSMTDCCIFEDMNPCPSVMEMLDVMPKIIVQSSLFEFLFTISPQISPEYVEGNFTVQYLSTVIPLCDINISGTLPNALAEMILWLHENNYISFTK